MKVETVKEIEYCKTQYFYQADSNKVGEKIDEAVFALRKMKIPGFRPGKAPDNVIKLKCRDQINAWVKRELTIQAYDDVIFETKIKPIGQPEIDNVKLNKDSFSCDLTICSRPKFELAEVKGMKLPNPHVVDDSESQKERALHGLRMRLGDAEPYGEGDFVANGHDVTMDVFATLDGEPYPDATAEGLMYKIGGNQVPGLDDNLLGMLPDEEREFDLIVHDKNIHFKVKIHMGMKTSPHDMNEEFAKKLGVPNLEELEKTLKVMADNRIKETRQSLIKDQILKRLLLDNEFECPVFLINQEAESLASNNGLDWNTIDNEMKETFVKDAISRVKTSIIIQTIREVEPESLLSDSEAINGIKNQLIASGQDAEAFIVKATKDDSLIGLVGQIKDNYVLQWIANKAEIME
jgi:trigger factor